MNDVWTVIPLEEIRPTLYVGRVDDDRLLQEADFYLGVGGNMAPDRLIESVPRIVRVGWLEAIDVIIGSALPGVELTYQPRPTLIPARGGFHYFSLDTQNLYWERIKLAKDIAVRVPNEIPDLRLELVAVPKASKEVSARKAK